MRLQADPMDLFKKIIPVYRDLAFLVLNTILLFGIVNLISLPIVSGIEHRSATSRPDVFFPEAYQQPGVPVRTSDSYIDSVLVEFHRCFNPQRQSFRYHPGIEYSHTPYRSEYLNIQYSPTELPYRSVLSPEYAEIPDSAVSIYCFGGSTTFGWFVSDEHTWPAFLMGQFPETGSGRTVITRNFGAAGYSPTQETNLFLRLLKSGNRPSLCIFMDGINTGPIWDCSEFTPAISKRFGLGQRELISNSLQVFPVVKLANLLTGNGFLQFSADSIHLPIEYSAAHNAPIANRFIQNALIRKKIAELYGVRIIQFLQPTIYITGKDHFLYAPLNQDAREDPMLRNALSNYPDVYHRIQANSNDYIDLSGIINAYPYMPVTDGCHYSPGFNLFLAKAVSKYIHPEALKGHWRDPAQATGVSYRN